MVPFEPVLAIEARQLEKTFHSGILRRRATAALRGVSLAVPRGAIVGILGPNGAGKTTLLSILATLLLPDAGTATVLGLDVVRDARRLRRRLNMASGNTSFLWNLHADEILSFYGRLYGLAGHALRQRVEALLEVCEIAGHRDVPYNQLSTGLRQRLALAKSLLNDPELLFLDEPTLGLDPDVSIRLRRHVASLRRERGMTIVLTTHYMREAEELCDEIAFIKGGEILARGTAAELKRQIGIGDVIRLRLDPPGVPWLAEVPGVLRCAESAGRVTCTVDEADKRLPELLRALHEQGVIVRDVQVREPDLEEVFVELAR
jgi:ABC-2 type transport system ATP-binding protein